MPYATSLIRHATLFDVILRVLMLLFCLPLYYLFLRHAAEMLRAATMIYACA